MDTFLYFFIVLISLYTFRFTKFVWKDGNKSGAVFVATLAVLLLILPLVNRFIFNNR